MDSIVTCDTAMRLADPSIYRDNVSRLNCVPTGNRCTPGCRLFDPSVLCDHSAPDLNYRTFVQAYWQYRVSALIKDNEWRLFYNCFHPQAKKDIKGKFDPSFPYDIPYLNNMQIHSNKGASEHLDPQDPAYWSEERVKLATQGTDLERRLAMTDWDWNWYSWALREGIKVTTQLAKSKVELDKSLFELLGNDYEDDGTYVIPADTKNFVRIKQLYQLVKDSVRVKLSFN